MQHAGTSSDDSDAEPLGARPSGVGSPVYLGRSDFPRLGTSARRGSLPAEPPRAMAGGQPRRGGDVLSGGGGGGDGGRGGGSAGAARPRYDGDVLACDGGGFGRSAASASAGGYEAGGGGNGGGSRPASAAFSRARDIQLRKQRERLATMGMAVPNRDGPMASAAQLPGRPAFRPSSAAAASPAPSACGSAALLALSTPAAMPASARAPDTPPVTLAPPSVGELMPSSSPQPPPQPHADTSQQAQAGRQPQGQGRQLEAPVSPCEPSASRSDGRGASGHGLGARLGSALGGAVSLGSAPSSPGIGAEEAAAAAEEPAGAGPVAARPAGLGAGLGGLTAPRPVLDLRDMRSFLTRPAPEGCLVQCQILRAKGGFLSAYPRYTLLLRQQGQPDTPILAARKRGQSKSSNYLISLDEGQLGRGSSAYFGKLRANFIGTEFVLYDGGLSPAKADKAEKEGRGMAGGARSELCAVLYKQNVLYARGPRRMNVLVPALTPGGQRKELRPSSSNDESSILEK